MYKYIYIKGQRYNHFDTYSTWEEAYKEAKHQKKRNKKNKYFILTIEKGFPSPYKIYQLYLTKTFKLW